MLEYIVWGGDIVDAIMLSYNIYGHFNVYLSLEDTINVVTWQWEWPLDFRDSTSTPIWNVYVDVDFDTHLCLISSWCQ